MQNMNKTKLPISDKATIRAEVKWNISLLNDEDKKAAEQSLCEKLLSSRVIQEAHSIIVYDALSDEIGLDPFIEQAREEGKNIFTIHLQGTSSFLPAEGIILVPWRAFTLRGKRIGRGGGWYDRLFRKYSQLYKIGVCFDWQIFPDLPQNEWDIFMDTVIVWHTQRDQKL